MPLTPPGPIGSWTSTYLTKFLNDWLRRNPLPAQDQLTIKKLAVSDSATVPEPKTGDSSDTAATTSFVQAAVDARTPKITSSALSGGPPASPSDSDIWIALAAGANGENWTFRYNAGSSSAYKWEFIGGPPISLSTTNPPSGGWAAANQWNGFGAPLQYTTVRAGEYETSAWYSVTFTAAGADMYIAPNSAALVVSSGLHVDTGSALGYVAATDRNAVAASTTITPAMYYTSSPNGTRGVGFSVIPIRIS